jgi:hypothetical protein
MKKSLIIGTPALFSAGVFAQTTPLKGAKDKRSESIPNKG